MIQSRNLPLFIFCCLLALPLQGQSSSDPDTLTPDQTWRINARLPGELISLFPGITGYRTDIPGYW